MRSHTYILAGGGSGGHLIPGLAVAEQLRLLDPAARVVFFCSSRAIDAQILEPTPYGMVVQPIRPMPRRKGQWPGFLRSLAASAKVARQAIDRIHPKAVLGLGGFAAAPAVWRAARVGYRTAILNPDMAPGKANQRLAPHVAMIFTQFPKTHEHFPKISEEMVQLVGCPVRSQLLSGNREEALAHFGLLKSRKTLLVFGGSQAAASINAALAALAGELDGMASQWQVLAIAGDGEPRLADREGSPKEIRIRRLAYCDSMDLAYAAADLVLCRAGASTVAELAATGTPAVVMPYPFADGHQQLNAQPLVEAGAGVICTDAQDEVTNAAALRQAMLGILTDPAKLAAMTDAMGKLGRPDAARAVAKWMIGPGAAQLGPNAKENLS